MGGRCGGTADEDSSTETHVNAERRGKRPGETEEEMGEPLGRGVPGGH